MNGKLSYQGYVFSDKNTELNKIRYSTKNTCLMVIGALTIFLKQISQEKINVYLGRAYA